MATNRLLLDFVPIVFRDLHLSDLPRLCEIERQCFKDPWPREWFRALILSRMLVWGACSGDIIAGYLVALPSSDQIHLANIAIDASYRRQGIARRLLERLNEYARQNGQGRIILEVRPSNISAIALYETEGFHQIGIEPGYYRGVEDALIYSLELS
jgi:ribosomal-protein-alanine N-acetyltransferase